MEEIRMRFFRLALIAAGVGAAVGFSASPALADGVLLNNLSVKSSTFDRYGYGHVTISVQCENAGDVVTFSAGIVQKVGRVGDVRGYTAEVDGYCTNGVAIRTVTVTPYAGKFRGGSATIDAAVETYNDSGESDYSELQTTRRLTHR
jgi:hypothetical protein